MGVRKVNACIQDMRTALNDFLNNDIIIFENSGNIAAGTLTDVRGGIIVLENGTKVVFNGDAFVPFEEMFVSICAIEQFMEFPDFDEAQATMSNPGQSLLERLRV